MRILRSSLICYAFFLTLMFASMGYVDIELAASTSSADISLNMPLTINNLKYQIGISL